MTDTDLLGPGGGDEVEPDDREALIDALVMSPLSDSAGTLLAPINATADAIIAAGFRRHPEPAKPSREDVRDAIAGHPIGGGYYGTTVGIDEAGEIADAVLALWPGRSERGES